MDKPVELDEALRRGHAEGFREPWYGGVTNGIAGLLANDLQELRAKGSIAKFSERDVETFENPGLEMVMGSLNFVFSSEFGEQLVSYEPPVLERFMDSAYVAEYDRDRDTLMLIVPEPLSELLPRYASRFRASAPPLDAVLDDYEPPTIDGTDYSGRHYICDYPFGKPDDPYHGSFCGEPLCRSACCWVKDNLCLIYLYFIGGHWSKITFYPFHTLLDAAGMEKVRAASIPRCFRAPA